MTDVRLSFGQFWWVELAPRTLDNINHVDAWQSYKAAFFSKVLLAKSFTLIVANPQSWSLTNELPDVKSVRIEKVTYHIVHIENCDQPFVGDIVSSPDLELGSLWIVFGQAKPDSYFKDLITDQTKRGMKVPFTPESLLMCETDGEIIYWLNPLASAEEVERLARQSEESESTSNTR